MYLTAMTYMKEKKNKRGRGKGRGVRNAELKRLIDQKFISTTI